MENQVRIIVTRPLRHTNPMPSGNIYSRVLLEQMVAEWKASEHPMFGTCNSDKNKPHLTDLTKVSSVVEEMHVDDEGLVVQLKLLDTPSGKNLKLFLDLFEDSNDSNATFSVLPKLSITSKDNVITSAKLYGFEFGGITPSDEWF